MKSTKEILDERKKTHGDFKYHAHMTQRLKTIIRTCSKAPLNDVQLEAIDMILHKIARITCGDPDYKDSWDDIAGYATLAANEINERQNS